jgi:hypothetical protein
MAVRAHAFRRLIGRETPETVRMLVARSINSPTDNVWPWNGQTYGAEGHPIWYLPWNNG